MFPLKNAVLRALPFNRRKASKFIGERNELTIDWCNKRLIIHDGVTAGGCLYVDLHKLCDATNPPPPPPNPEPCQPNCDDPVIGIIKI